MLQVKQLKSSSKHHQIKSWINKQRQSMWKLHTWVTFVMLAIGFADANLVDTEIGVQESNSLHDADSVKIVGGEEVQPGEFPYQVFIEKIWNSTLIFKCGGTVYNSEFIITAAHCLYFKDMEVFASPRKIWITAGTHDLATKDPEIKKFEQVIRGQKTFPHPDFKFSTLSSDGKKGSYPIFDVGLIKLEKPLVFNERVQPIPISRKNFSLRGNGTVTGFGRFDPNGRWTKQMRKIDIPLVEWRECSKVFNGAANVTADMFCTGTPNGKVTPCNGDSGGPIACSSRKQKVLCGISSFGAKKCSNYSVYTRVSSYFDWIQSVAGQQNHFRA